MPKSSRPQVVKHLWAYIKTNSLQNPSNGREILCNADLKAVFGVDKIDMFRMNKVLGTYVSLLSLVKNGIDIGVPVGIYMKMKNYRSRARLEA